MDKEHSYTIAYTWEDGKITVIDPDGKENIIHIYAFPKTEIIPAKLAIQTASEWILKDMENRRRQNSGEIYEAG